VTTIWRTDDRSGMLPTMPKAAAPEPLITWYDRQWRKWKLTVDDSGTATAVATVLIKSFAPRAVFDLSAVVGVSSGQRSGKPFVSVITTGTSIELSALTIWRARAVANCIDEARREARRPGG